MPTPRREFISQLATATVALVGVACAPAGIQPVAQGAAPAAPPAPPAPVGKTTFDDTWTRRLTGKHRGVFDSPEIGAGIAIFQAQLWISGVKEALGTSSSDPQAVLVLRHRAVPMVLNDMLWEKYQLGKETKTKNDRTKKFETSNPFREDLEKLEKQGSIVLGCNLAAMGLASRIATRTNQDVEIVRREFRSNLVPGALLMPSGIYAVHRAQEAGCSYIRSI